MNKIISLVYCVAMNYMVKDLECNYTQLFPENIYFENKGQIRKMPFFYSKNVKVNSIFYGYNILTHKIKGIKHIIIF